MKPQEVAEFVNQNGSQKMSAGLVASMLCVSAYQMRNAAKIAGVRSGFDKKLFTGLEWGIVLSTPSAIIFLNKCLRKKGIESIPEVPAVQPVGLSIALDNLPEPTVKGFQTTDLCLATWLKHEGFQPTDVVTSSNGYASFSFTTDSERVAKDLQAAIMAYDSEVALVEPKKFIGLYRGSKRQVLSQVV